MNNNVVIKKLKITGFKSIENIELTDISNFMVLAGANGSGKSNFVDALYFLSLVLRFGVDEAVRKMGGLYVITQKDNKVSKICYYIHFSLYDEEYQYELNLHLEYQKIYVEYENLIKVNKYGNEIDYAKQISEIRNKLTQRTNIKKSEGESIIPILTGTLIATLIANDTSLSEKVSYPTILNGLTNIGDGEKDKKSIQSSPYFEKNSFFYQFLNHESIFETIGNIAIYRIDVNLAKVSRSEYSEELEEKGDNLISVLAELEKNDELRETILDWLGLIVPEMQDIYTYDRLLDNSKILEFLEESGKKFPAHLVSDGTIYALCMLVAILTRTQKAGITIIEEPERGLHPKAIGELIGFMREHASINHPIILTTHSESVVRELELDELFFVSKENGKTKIKSVKNSVVDKNKIPLDTAWLTNVLDGGLPW